MKNSFRQAANLSGAFEVMQVPESSPLLLVDDIVDSRWTLTVLTALLKQAGAGPVYPFALAMATPSGSN